MTTSFGEDVELEHLHVAGEIENGAPTVENSLPVPQVVNHRVTIPSSSIYPREGNTRALEACTPVLTTVLFIIAKKWKQPKCSSIDELLNKMKFIYTMEHYLAFKEKILKRATM